ncbi:MAG: FG-GAP repeat protein [Planctomycetes bacterium]|nr:FG-GAP repeat protein [Planctomycetota bacterium]
MTSIDRRTFVATFLLLFLGGVASAQQTLQSLSLGAPAGAEPSVVPVGDLDGDDVIDFVVCEPHDDAMGTDTGSVSTRSGADGSLLYTLDGDDAGALFGFSVDGVGDLDDDGFDDFAVGAPGSGSVTLVSGDDGATLLVITGSAADEFGFALGPVDDLDADGELDLLIGAPGDDDAGTDAGIVYIVSTATGDVLDSMPGDAAGGRFGAFLGTHTLGPWGMDLGTTGGIDATIGSQAAGSHVHGLDLGGSTDTCLWTGGALAGLGLVGDVDGDGITDMLAAGVDPNTGYDIARILSGDGGSEVFTYASDTAGTGLGVSLAVIDDVDGDQARDLALGEPGALSGRGRVVIVSSSDGHVVHRICGPANGTGFGASLARVEDRDADGDAELAIGATTGPDGDRHVTIVSLRSSNQNLLAGGELSLRATVDGIDVQLTLRDAPADSTVAVSVGTSLVVDADDGSLRADTELVVGALVTDSTGSLDADTSLPGALSGQPLYFEAYVADPSGGVDVTDPVPAEEV